MVHPLFAAARRKLSSFWSDLPLRIKGLVVVAVPITALVAVTASFYFFQRADRKLDNLVDQAVELDNLTQSCLTELLEGECAVNEYFSTGRKERLGRLGEAANKFYARYDRLEKLLRDDPDLLRRLRRIRQLFQDKMEIWDEMGSHASTQTPQALWHSDLFGQCQSSLQASRQELRAMRSEQQAMLVTRVARVNRLRTQKLVVLTGDALLGLGGGLLAILLFTAGVVRGVEHLQQDAARIEQRLPVLPRFCGRDELGALEDALHTAGVSLRHTEEERDRFFTLSVDMLCVLDLQGHFKRVNAAFAGILGHPNAELLAKGVLDFVHPEDRAGAAARLLELAAGAATTYQESRLRCADGSYKWLAWSAAPVQAEGVAYAVLRDISGRKLDEQALRESNTRLCSVLDSMTDAFMSVDREWRLTYVNPEAKLLWMRQGQDLIGRNLWELFPEAVGGPFYSMYHEVMRTRTPAHLEDFYPHPPLNRWFEVHAYPTDEGLSVFFRDATERRESEARIQRALQEKEVLLREVHHRVKNNLQVIYSMLRLQAGYVHDERLIQVLAECRERVHAMALLHDQLHRARDLSSVNLADYIKSLAASLFCSYGVQSSKIGLHTHLEDVAVPIDTAIPCGLIVNELISNSLRHAFPGSSTGHVSVGLRARRGGELELTVGDNGRGFVASSDAAHAPSLGLRLVSLLASQLETEVQRTNQNGTHYRFLFRPFNQKENK